MKKIKEFLSLFLLVGIVLGSSVPVFADEVDSTTNISGYQQMVLEETNERGFESTSEVCLELTDEVKIISSDECDSDHFSNQEPDIDTQDISFYMVKPFAGRDGNTTIVDIFLGYTGDYLCPAIRFRTMAVESEDGNEMYALIGDGDRYCTYEGTAGKILNVYVTSAFVPISEKKLKVYIEGLQSYCPDHEVWHTTAKTDFTVKIN